MNEIPKRNTGSAKPKIVYRDCDGCGYPVRFNADTGEELDCIICGDDYHDELEPEDEE